MHSDRYVPRTPECNIVSRIIGERSEKKQRRYLDCSIRDQSSVRTAISRQRDRKRDERSARRERKRARERRRERMSEWVSEWVKGRESAPGHPDFTSAYFLRRITGAPGGRNRHRLWRPEFSGDIELPFNGGCLSPYANYTRICSSNFYVLIYIYYNIYVLI